MGIELRYTAQEAMYSAIFRQIVGIWASLVRIYFIFPHTAAKRIDRVCPNNIKIG